jgi:hypothetical protein
MSSVLALRVCAVATSAALTTIAKRQQARRIIVIL